LAENVSDLLLTLKTPKPDLRGVGVWRG